MFGTNKVRKPFNQTGDMLQVRDVWHTVQGEGPFMGSPAIFARLTGCNLRCWFCDTEWDDANDETVLTEELISRIMSVRPQRFFRPTNLVVLTGGEPLLQNVQKLCEALITHKGMQVQIETAGTQWQEWVGPLVETGGLHIVVSPKTPNIHPQIAQYASAFKYVIKYGATDDADGLPLFNTQNKSGLVAKLARPPHNKMPVYLQPCDEYDPAKNRANKQWVGQLSVKHGYIAGLQIHKELDLA